MNMNRLGSQNSVIKKVCVVGAGVMGQAIAAHMANAGIDCHLLDLPSAGSEKNAIAIGAIGKIASSKPALAFNKAVLSRITPGNTDDLGFLPSCDLVIEAIIEQLPAKRAMFDKLAPHLGPHTIVASNTSGLSIKDMLAGQSPSFCERFLVMHFFNPVRYLHLLEVVPGPTTKPEIVAKMKEFGTTKLGKGVVIGKDTPNFIANRIGVYGMMEAMRAVTHGGFSIEEVDAVFGAKLGRPKSAIFRTADVVGLDTFIHVAQNCYDNLPKDECHEIFQIPEFLKTMVQQGSLGQKSGQGFYKKSGENILALDPKTLTYREKASVRFESMGEIRMMSSLAEKMRYMYFAKDRAGQLFFDMCSKICIYSANRLGEIADSIADIDNALAWGFGWEMGPFKTWDAIGVEQSVSRMSELGYKVTPWVLEMLASGRKSFYQERDGVVDIYQPGTKSSTPVKFDQREWRLDHLRVAKKLVADTDAYSLIDAGNGALIVEFHTKMNAIDLDVLAGINRGIDLCEAGQFEALVIGNEGANFSVGANLLLLYMAASQNMWDEIDKTVRSFQSTCTRLKYCPVPTVSAPFQLTLGGGCEISMWCDRIHAQAETYIGLVEVGVGLIPGGGGNIEMLARTLQGAIDSPTFVTEHMLQRALETIAMAKVATSAREAQDLLYFDQRDSFSMNHRFHLHDACQVAMDMVKAGYRPPERRKFRLPGKNAYATFAMGLQPLLHGGFISEHDYKISLKVAHVLTGGNTNSYELLSEERVLDLEREAFLSLCGEEKTQQRIAYMLENNKPLRN
jgi:3-hydroxyacyl-CoA dehydrogenase